MKVHKSAKKFHTVYKQYAPVISFLQISTGFDKLIVSERRFYI